MSFLGKIEDMDFMKKRTLISLFILLFLTVCICSFFPSVEHKACINEAEEIGNNYSLYILDNEKKIVQPFQMQGETLKSISLFLTGYEATSNEIIEIKIKDEGHTAYSKKISLMQFNPSGYTEIPVDTTLKNGYTYNLELCANGKGTPRVVTIPEAEAFFKYGKEIVKNQKIAFNFCGEINVIDYKHLSIQSLILLLSLCGAYVILKINIFNCRSWRIDELFVVVTFFCVLILLGTTIITHGENTSHFFFHDEIDTGMDFFNSIVYLKGNAPYKLYSTLYPPLANAFFAILFSCVPKRISAFWPTSFEESVEMRQTKMDLRFYQQPILLFVFFIISCIILLLYICQKILKENMMSVFASMVFSYGMIMAVERGNIVILSLVFSYLFIIGRKSNNLIKRELSYVSLAIAAGLKLYPALYGILLLKEKKWKEAIRTFIYGCLALVLPCFLFQEKLNGLLEWGKILFQFKGTSEIPWIGNGMANLVNRVCLYLSKIIKMPYMSNKSNVVALSVLFALLLCSIMLQKEEECIFILTVVLCSMQSQGEYIFIYYLIPLLIMLKNDVKITKEHSFFPICTVLLTVPLPLFYIRDIFYPRSVLVQILYIGIIVWTVIHAVFNRVISKVAST